METVGKDGVINVDDSKGFETSLEVTEGLKYDKGFISPYMLGDREKKDITLEDAYVLEEWNESIFKMSVDEILVSKYELTFKFYIGEEIKIKL